MAQHMMGTDADLRSSGASPCMRGMASMRVPAESVSLKTRPPPACDLASYNALRAIRDMIAAVAIGAVVLGDKEDLARTAMLNEGHAVDHFSPGWRPTHVLRAPVERYRLAIREVNE